MCGRLSQAHLERMQRLTEIAGKLDLPPRYNVAPSTLLAAIRNDDAGHAHWAMLRWGLLPAWSKERKIAYKTINAMAETVASKPAYRSAFRHRRCVIPANGYYEWREEQGRKQPFYMHSTRDDEPLLLAGLWERWEGEGESIESCTIVTTDASASVREVHNRMPVVLEWEQLGLWLDNSVTDPARVQPLLQPARAELVVTRVTPRMNSPRFDSPECVTPVAAEPAA